MPQQTIASSDAWGIILPSLTGPVAGSGLQLTIPTRPSHKVKFKRPSLILWQRLHRFCLLEPLVQNLPSAVLYRRTKQLYLGNSTQMASKPNGVCFGNPTVREPSTRTTGPTGPVPGQPSQPSVPLLHPANSGPSHPVTPSCPVTLSCPVTPSRPVTLSHLVTPPCQASLSQLPPPHLATAKPAASVLGAGDLCLNEHNLFVKPNSEPGTAWNLDLTMLQHFLQWPAAWKELKAVVDEKLSPSVPITQQNKEKVQEVQHHVCPFCCNLLLRSDAGISSMGNGQSSLLFMQTDGLPSKASNIT